MGLVGRCALFLAVVLISTASRAEVVQVTEVPAGRSVSRPSVDFSGRWIVFASTANIGGLNPTPIGNVFVYDAVSGSFERITPEGGNDPVISPDGRFIAFSSDANYARRNADNSEEIFRFDRQRRRFAQITRDDLGDGSSVLPSISNKGSRIAFETTSNLRRRNPDLSNEVYLFNRSGNTPLSRDPEGDGESYTPAVSADGSLVAFVSTSNLTGRNPDFSQELMLYDVKERQLIQATNDVEGLGESSSPAVSGNGKIVVFVSSSNLGNGANPDNVSAVWWKRGSGYSVPITVRSDGLFDGDQPTVDTTGEWIAFVSGEDVVGRNPDRSQEIFLYNRLRKTFYQVTSGVRPCVSVAPRITGSGARVVYLSNCDPFGTNPDRGFEVFWAANPALFLVLTATGPVELVVTDPAGRWVDASTSSIPLASYQRLDLDGDPIEDRRVVIPEAMAGMYRVQVLARAGATGSEPVRIEASLNGLVRSVAEGTVGELAGSEVQVGNQSLRRPTSTIDPTSGRSARVTLAARLPHPKPASGPIELLWFDGTQQQSFALGTVEALSPRGTYSGIVDGFEVSLRLRERPDGTLSLRFSARGGDASEFAGSENLGMTVLVRVGPYTHFYNWRFLRSALSGKLTLR